MSTLKYRISLMAAVAVMAGCTIKKNVPETDINSSGDSEDGTPSGFVSIAALKSMYVNRPVTITSEVSIRGRVVSSDRWGNFYKTLCIEDQSGGIAVRIDLEDYFRTFAFGDIVTVYCNTLTLGTYGGATQLGVLTSVGSNDISPIPENYILSSVGITTPGTEPPVSRREIHELGPSDIYRYVEITDVQFEDWTEGMTWCEDDADTERTLINRTGSKLPVRTSRYATFARDILPGGSGAVRGIIGYFNGSYQLTLINKHYAVMEQERF